jgi:hypothetical protein
MTEHIMNASNEPTPAAGNATLGEGIRTLGEGIRTSLQSHLVTVVWGVFLLFGGVVFLAYFASIGFMPEIDVKTSVLLLAVSASTGGFLLVVAVLYLVCPGWLWIYETHRQESLKSPGWFAWPTLGLLLGFLSIPRWWWVGTFGIVSVAAPLLLLLFGSLRARLAFFFRKLKDKLYSKQKVVQIVQRGGTAGVFVYSLLLIFLVFLPLLALVDLLIKQNPYLPKTAMLTAVAMVIIIWFFNTLFVVARPSSISPYLGVGFMILFLLIAMSGAWTAIPKWVMSIYKFGNLTNASLVLDEMGCAIVGHHGLKVTRYSAEPKTGAVPTPTACSLPYVTIHSRLGNTYYVEVSRGDASLRFTLPAEHVLSWAKEVPRASPRATP